MKTNILLTGASGYVGAMLADQLLNNKDWTDRVGYIIAIDKEKPDELLSEVLEKNTDRIFFIQKNLSDNSWIEDVKNIEEEMGRKENNFNNEKYNGGKKKKYDYKINAAIHTAWQIREMYGKKQLQNKWNIGGSDNVFDYVFANNIEKFVHFSTVSSYGAYSDNKIDYYWTEEDKFRKTDYLYAEEKRIVEEHLKEKFEKAKIQNNLNINKEKKANQKEEDFDTSEKENRESISTQVVIIRPASITGPRGRYGKVRFGLQSALAGGVGNSKSFVHKIVGAMTKWTPVTKNWLRQFVHEDDITNVVAAAIFNKTPNDYEIFNVCPPGDSMLGADMAKAVNKKPLKLHPQFIRFVFFCMWHLTHGKIPTSKGGYKTYSYPIAVDGSKVTRIFNYKYFLSCKEAFTKDEGRYANKYLR